MLLKEKNLETYSLIWLDSSVNNSQENIQAQNILRTSINHLLTFENDEFCLRFIDGLSDDDRVILIVNGQFGQIIVPQVALLRQIISIYIYCRNKNFHEHWAKDFPKVNKHEIIYFKRLYDFHR
jgi:hypothetical protein